MAAQQIGDPFWIHKMRVFHNHKRSMAAFKYAKAYSEWLLGLRQLWPTPWGLNEDQAKRIRSALDKMNSYRLGKKKP